MLKDLNAICIYGAGFRAKILYQYLIAIGKDIDCFVTTNKQVKDNLYGKSIKQVWSMAESKRLQRYIFVIAVQEKYWPEIRKTLEALGALPDNIYCLDYKTLLNKEEFANKFTDSGNIYKKLQDEKSKKIWCQGVKYRLTNDYSFFLKSIEYFYEKEDCLKREDFISMADWLANRYYEGGKKIGLFVQSNKVLSFSYPRLKEMGIQIDCICMENERMCNRLVYGVPVISMDKAVNYLKNGWLIIGSGMKQFTEEKKEMLFSYGFSEKEIVVPCSQNQLFAYGRQYFDLQELAIEKEEVFVDVGCLDCDTDLNFINWCNGNYKCIYAFEPDKASYEKCLEKARENGIENIVIENKGLWSRKDKLKFGHNINSALSKITQNGLEEIDTIALDDYLAGEKVTFIKMDIEGAELEALKGAEKTIKKYKPKLAISIYHKVNDFIDIPEYLLDIVPEYKFYIRHYSCYKFETILYAII